MIDIFFMAMMLGMVFGYFFGRFIHSSNENGVLIICLSKMKHVLKKRSNEEGLTAQECDEWADYLDYCEKQV